MTPEPVKSETIVTVLVEEYRMLWSEMNNRWAQQQNLILTAWFVLGGALAFVASKWNPDQLNGIYSGFVEVILLIPFALLTTCGVFIRHEDKVWRIVGYIYLSLRPRLQRIVDAGRNPDDPIVLWQWPEFELSSALSIGGGFIFQPLLELCRYLMMIGPAVYLLARTCKVAQETVWTTCLYVFDCILAILMIYWALVALLKWWKLLREIRHRSTQRDSEIPTPASAAP